MKNEHYDKLEILYNRLYCVMSTVEYGDKMMLVHNDAVMSELYEIWKQIGDIIKEKYGAQENTT